MTLNLHKWRGAQSYTHRAYTQTRTHTLVPSWGVTKSLQHGQEKDLKPNLQGSFLPIHSSGRGALTARARFDRWWGETKMLHAMWCSQDTNKKFKLKPILTLLPKTNQKFSTSQTCLIYSVSPAMTRKSKRINYRKKWTLLLVFMF